MNREISPDFLLDVSNLSCPSPLLKMKAMVYRLASGQTLEVKGVHSLQVSDFEQWCQRSGLCFLLKQPTSAEFFDIIIKK